MWGLTQGRECHQPLEQTIPQREGVKSLLGKDTASSLKRGYVGRHQLSPLIRQVATSPAWQKSQHHTNVDNH